MQQIRIFILSLCCILMVLPPCFSQDAKEIHWMTFKEALAKNEKAPKKIFIDVYTDWCGWCKKMDASTFTNDSIIQYMNKNFYAVKLDAETKDTIKYKGVDYVFVPQYRSNGIAPYFLNGKL